MGNWQDIAILAWLSLVLMSTPEKLSSHLDKPQTNRPTVDTHQLRLWSSAAPAAFRIPTTAVFTVNFSANVIVSIITHTGELSQFCLLRATKH